MKKRRTLMYEMAQTRCAWNAHMRKIALSVGIPDSYRRVIMFVHRNPGVSQRSIAEFEDVTTSAVNQVVKSMLAEGYLRKETDPLDKRSCKLYLTEKGEDAAHMLRKKLNESDDAITAFAGEEQEKELMDFLRHLTEFIQKELE
ncbi:MAG: MarR family winged helix-turn-helix transcriptional regulator [Lachnospiraceae bacterium]|nr:MarR family winged helix-turn-helix transcriptional regulator [Lachnospiraceae bacterium]